MGGEGLGTEAQKLFLLSLTGAIVSFHNRARDAGSNSDFAQGVMMEIDRIEKVKVKLASPKPGAASFVGWTYTDLTATVTLGGKTVEGAR